VEVKEGTKDGWKIVRGDSVTVVETVKTAGPCGTLPFIQCE
jgi:hypothetical protein